MLSLESYKCALNTTTTLGARRLLEGHLRASPLAFSWRKPNKTNKFKSRFVCHFSFSTLVGSYLPGQSATCARSPLAGTKDSAHFGGIDAVDQVRQRNECVRYSSCALARLVRKLIKEGLWCPKWGAQKSLHIDGRRQSEIKILKFSLSLSPSRAS